MCFVQLVMLRVPASVPGSPTKVSANDVWSMPKISVTLNNILFSRLDSSPGRCVFALLTESIDSFLTLCKVSHLCTVTTVQDDADENDVLLKLQQMGAFAAGLARHRVLFCSTTAGRASMVRQMQPTLHIESESEVVDVLTSRVPNVSLVTTLPEDFKKCVALVGTIWQPAQR